MAVSFADFLRDSRIEESRLSELMALGKKEVAVYKLRGYQEEAIEATLLKMETEENLAVIAPTGSGKTVMAAFLMLRLLEKARAQKKRLVFLVHRTVLVDQTMKEIADVIRSLIVHEGREDLAPVLRNIGKIHRGSYLSDDCDIVVASIQSIKSNGDFYAENLNPSVLIYDECHTTRYCPTGEWLIETFPEAYPIGFTATPYYMKKTEAFADHWDAVVVVAQYRTLVDRGSLTPIHYTSYVRPYEVNDISIASNGDFKKAEVLQRFNTPERMEMMVDRWEETVAKVPEHLRKTIVFSIDTDHGHAIRNAFAQRGYNFEVVGTRAGDSFSIKKIQEFRDGKLDGLISVRKLDIGFNVEDCTICILGFATRSEGRYIQAVGRVGRTFEGKEWAYLLDFGANVLRFGTLEDKVLTQETVLAPAQRGKGTGDAPYKICPECNTVHHASAKVCAEDKGGCGYVFPVKEDRSELDGEMVDVLPMTSVVDRDTARRYYRSLRKLAFYQGKHPNSASHDYEAKGFADEYPIPSVRHYATETMAWFKGAVFGELKTRKKRLEKAAFMVSKLQESGFTADLIEKALNAEFDLKIAKTAMKDVKDEQAGWQHTPVDLQPFVYQATRSTAEIQANILDAV